MDDDGNNIIGGAVGGRWEMEFVATAAGRGRRPWPRHGGGGVFLGYEEPNLNIHLSWS